LAHQEKEKECPSQTESEIERRRIKYPTNPFSEDKEEDNYSEIKND
jgi:hypothetical protein